MKIICVRRDSKTCQVYESHSVSGINEADAVPLKDFGKYTNEADAEEEALKWIQKTGDTAEPMVVYPYEPQKKKP